MPLNLPNLITLLRIVLIPLIVGVFYLPEAWLSESGKNLVATAIFIFLFILVFEWRRGQPWRERARPMITALIIAAVTGALVVLVFERVFLVRLP